MSQIDAIINMMKKGWTSTAMTQEAGITSWHSRLAEWRGRAVRYYKGQWGDTSHCYQVGKDKFKLLERERTIKTRWEKSVKIKEYRLRAIK
jgi:hypothetical protein